MKNSFKNGLEMFEIYKNTGRGIKGCGYRSASLALDGSHPTELLGVVCGTSTVFGLPTRLPFEIRFSTFDFFVASRRNANGVPAERTGASK